jgi:Ca2+-transporting ATPase
MIEMPESNSPYSSMSGADIDSFTESELVERVSAVRIFYRTNPVHKLAIIRAFQARGAVVAMTGDGVNDAPALRLAVAYLTRILAYPWGEAAQMSPRKPLI